MIVEFVDGGRKIKTMQSIPFITPALVCDEFPVGGEVSMEYTDEECDAKAEGAHQEWVMQELYEENERLHKENAALKAEVGRLRENHLKPKEKLHRLLHKPSLALRPFTRVEENHGD